MENIAVIRPLKDEFLEALLSDFSGITLNDKLYEWDLMNLDEFKREIKKINKQIDACELRDIEELFIEFKYKLRSLKQKSCQ